MGNRDHFAEISSGIAGRGLYPIARSLVALQIRNVQYARCAKRMRETVYNTYNIQCTLSRCTFGWNAQSDKIHIQTECAFEKDI